MEHTNHDTSENKSYMTTVLAAIVLLTVLYFAAKGCTNRDNHHETSTNKHAGITNTTISSVVRS